MTDQRRGILILALSVVLGAVAVVGGRAVHAQQSPAFTVATNTVTYTPHKDVFQAAAGPYKLSATPIPATIQVVLNGSVLCGECVFGPYALRDYTIAGNVLTLTGFPDVSITALQVSYWTQ